MPIKPLTETEIDILEIIDATNRLMIRYSTEDFCADCRAKGTEEMCGAEIAQILKSLSRRGYINLRPRLMITDHGLKQIKRTRVMHLRNMDGVKFDGHNRKCTKEEPCWDCKRVKQLKESNQ